MPPPAIKRDRLCPCLVTVQRCEPDELACRFGNVDIGEVTESLTPEAPTVIDKHRIEREILWPGEGQGAFLDLNRQESNSVRGFDMTFFLAMVFDHQLLAVGDTPPGGAEEVNPLAFSLLSTSQRRLEGTMHCGHPRRSDASRPASGHT